MVACVVHINYGRILLKWLIQEVEMGKRGSDYTTPESSSVAQIQLSTCSTISTCCSWLASCQGNSSRRRERHPHIQFNTGAYDSDETSPQTTHLLLPLSVDHRLLFPGWFMDRVLLFRKSGDRNNKRIANTFSFSQFPLSMILFYCPCSSQKVCRCSFYSCKHEEMLKKI